MKTVICSHGFGVKADSRGMFPEIAEAFPDWHFTTFDYNEIKPNGDTVVPSLREQAEKLQGVIDETQADEIVLLAHSQGCVVAGLVDLRKIAKVVLLAPPVQGSMQAVIDMMASKPGAVYNPNGTSTLPRADGSTTYLRSEYLAGLDRIAPMELYDDVAAENSTMIVRALDDEILGITNINTLSDALHVDIAADHNFTGESREEVIKVLRDFIQ